LRRFTNKLLQFGTGHSGRGGHGEFHNCAAKQPSLSKRSNHIARDLHFPHDSPDHPTILRRGIMNILELAGQIGLKPVKTSSTQGGEYHCACPDCGGNDRFILWPEKGRFWCRQCKQYGGLVNFCMKFLGLSFQAARAKANIQSSRFHSHFDLMPTTAPVTLTSRSWEEKAKAFIASSHQRLIIDTLSMQLLKKRGLSIETIQKNQLGWNPVQTFTKRSEWGLKETEKKQWLCLPIGIVIPIFQEGNIQKLKIRKSEWKEEDPFGKYYEVPGSSNRMPIFGTPSHPIAIIIESEFDAMLLTQQAEDLCICLALGGAQKRPDAITHKWLQERKLILFALDFDDAGKKEYTHWKAAYPTVKAWPTPREKSPGDYFATGGDLRKWIDAGIRNSVPSLSSYPPFTTNKSEKKL